VRVSKNTFFCLSTGIIHKKSERLHTSTEKFMKGCILYKMRTIRLFEICFHFAGHRSSTQEFSAGPTFFM
jgi:hypothetical protein